MNETLQTGLAAKEDLPPRRYRLKPVAIGGVLPGVNVDKALCLSAALEDDEIAHELDLRK